MSETGDQKRPEWMSSISANVDPNEYLSGRKIDKTFELCQQEKADRAKELRTNLIASDKLKLTGDPMLDLERRKYQLKLDIISNPIRLRQFRERLLAERRKREGSPRRSPVEESTQSTRTNGYSRRSSSRSPHRSSHNHGHQHHSNERRHDSHRSAERSHDRPRSSRDNDRERRHHHTRDDHRRHRLDDRRREDRSRGSPSRHDRSRELPKEHDSSRNLPRRHDRSKDSPKRHDRSKDSPKRDDRYRR